ncbi:MAG: EamA family transporter [Gammaproteobacteria bacterium]|nr:EamA family transporter [Gammaproteobacteria bacterium]
MQTLLLYATVVLIWGSTWAAIPFQLGTVAEEVSVSYRFGLAAVALYAYAFASRRSLRLPATAYPLVFLQGALLFCINYFFVYYGTAYLTSGVVAVLFSSILILNAIFERLFFGRRIDARFWLAATVGISGIALIFSSEISDFSFTDRSVHGGLLVVFGTLVASLGNMAAVANTKRGLPVVAVNAHAMAFAAVLALLIALALGKQLDFSARADYVLSLLYLAVFGSAVAFGCYLALLRLIGATRASYSSVLFPVVALLISTAFEGYRWTIPALIGMLLTLAGNWLILSQRKKITAEGNKDEYR